MESHKKEIKDAEEATAGWERTDRKGMRDSGKEYCRGA